MPDSYCARRFLPPRFPMVLALALGVAGCGSDGPSSSPSLFTDSAGGAASSRILPGSDTRPGPSGSVVPSSRPGGWAGFYPLEPGSRRTYVSQATIDLVPNAGVEPPDPNPYVVNAVETREIVGTEELFGRQYVVERQDLREETEFGIYESTSWIRYRQDRSGLYEADVCTADPPGPETGPNCGDPGATQRLMPRGMPAGFRNTWDQIERRRTLVSRALHAGVAAGRSLAPAGGALPEEITRLAYPLHPGTDWIIRDEPLYLGGVETRESIEVPAGRFSSWRTSITIPEFFGPNDQALLWFGSGGFLKMYQYAEFDWTGESGEVLGTAYFTGVTELSDIESDVSSSRGVAAGREVSTSRLSGTE